MTVTHQAAGRTNLASGQRVVRLGVTDLSYHRVTAAVVALVLQRMGLTGQRRPFDSEAFYEF